MPGLVIFRRRWSVGSDDLVVPGIFFFTLHCIWLVILSIILASVKFDTLTRCTQDLRTHVLGYIVIVAVCIVVEACIIWISLRGSIFYTEPRNIMQYALFIRLGILGVELVWLILGVIWVAEHYNLCPAQESTKQAVLGIVISNWVVLIGLITTVYCTFDATGRGFVKLRRLKQKNLRGGKYRPSYKERLRQEQVQTQKVQMEEYRSQWSRRCERLCCCAGVEKTKEQSFNEVAKLLAEFFGDLDLVASDIVAGMMLLRKEQKKQRQSIILQTTNDIYQFLSGVPVNPLTRFLNPHDEIAVGELRSVVYYFKYAMAAYGWPLYVMMNKAKGVCSLLKECKCCCVPACDKASRHSFGSASTSVEEDNCCSCNISAIKQQLDLEDIDIVHASFHSAVCETPFFVAVDHTKKKIVISCRGTLSLQDCLTDMIANSGPLPLHGVPKSWWGHKGMVDAAVYVKRIVDDNMILQQAFAKAMERSGHQNYDIQLVGHSLGAGTAAILAILLKEEYGNVRCYAYSPPGGLISEQLAEHSKSFITSVVVGKDIVIRLGIKQLEKMRTELLDVMRRSSDPKWQVIGSSLCCCIPEPRLLPPLRDNVNQPGPLAMALNAKRCSLDASLTLSTSLPMYPPGRIMHIVRNHPKKIGCQREEPIFHVIWSHYKSFDSVIVSPAMIDEHLPDYVDMALNAVLDSIEAQFESHQSRQVDFRKTSESSLPGTSESAGVDSRRESSLESDVSRTKRDSASLSLLSTSNFPRAPLATVESLSETGSVISTHSNINVNHSERAQRPVSEGYCYYIDGVQDGPVRDSPHTLPRTTPQKNQMTTLATIELTPTKYHDLLVESASDYINVDIEEDGSIDSMERYFPINADFIGSDSGRGSERTTLPRRNAGGKTPPQKLTPLNTGSQQDLPRNPQEAPPPKPPRTYAQGYSKYIPMSQLEEARRWGKANEIMDHLSPISTGREHSSSEFDDSVTSSTELLGRGRYETSTPKKLEFSSVVHSKETHV